MTWAEILKSKLQLLAPVLKSPYTPWAIIGFICLVFAVIGVGSVIIGPDDHTVPGLFNALFFGGMGRVSLKCHTPTQTAL